MIKSIKKFIRWIVGPSWDSREHKQMMVRVNALPEDYRYVFHKIKRYLANQSADIYTFGPLFMDLLELFEECSANDRPVLDVIGIDVGAFCNELLLTHSNTSPIYAEISKDIVGDINKDISEKFKKEGR